MPAETHAAKASARYRDRLKERGHHKLSVWISPATLAALAALTPRYGSAKHVVEAAVKALAKAE